MWGETEPCGIWDNFLVIFKFHLRQYGLLSFFRVVARREAPQIRRFVETCRDRSSPSKPGCVELGLPERKEILPFPGREGKTPLLGALGSEETLLGSSSTDSGQKVEVCVCLSVHLCGGDGTSTVGSSGYTPRPSPSSAPFPGHG